MKRIVFLLLFVLGFCSVEAQVANNTETEGFVRCLQPGTSLIDVYYGAPNFFAFIARTTILSSEMKDVTVSSIGPMGMKYEYLLGEEAGVGLEVNYSNLDISYTDKGTDANNNAVTYHYKYSSPAIRVMGAFNYHFVSSEKFEAYFAGKLGYYHRSLSVVTDDPKYVIKKFGIPLNSLAIRLEVGARLFLTDFLGIHANFGFFGGPIIAGGLTVKIK